MAIFQARIPSSGDTSVNAQAPTSSDGTRVPTASEAPAATRKSTFGFSEIAHMFVRLRRHQKRATGLQEGSTESAGATEDNGTPLRVAAVPAEGSSSTTRIDTQVSNQASESELSPSSPSSPSRIRVRDFYPYSRPSAGAKTKPHHLVSCSGDEPISHPGIKETVLPGIRPILVEYTDRYDCVGGVNVTTLLRATRNTLLETVGTLGANALTDEQWDCTICGPKHGTYKVEVHYAASATRCSKPDPHRPVAVDQVKGIPGLMTIIKRED